MAKTRKLTRLEKDFIEAYPADVISLILNIIAAQYPAALAGERGKLTGRRLGVVVGQKRHHYIESELAKLRDRYSGVVVKSDGGGNEHVEFRSGRFVMTVAYVPDDEGFVRHSIYREALADAFQLRFEFDAVEEPVGIECYAIIVHAAKKTPEGVDRGQVGRIRIGFPRRDFSGWLFPPIDLVTLYSAAIDQDTRREDVPDSSFPRIRPAGPLSRPKDRKAGDSSDTQGSSAGDTPPSPDAS